MKSLDYLYEKKVNTIFVTKYQIDFGFSEDLHISIENKLSIKNSKTKEEVFWESGKENAEFTPLRILNKKITSCQFKENNYLIIDFETDLILIIYILNSGIESFNITYKGEISVFY
jgi:hypothetical protein